MTPAVNCLKKAKIEHKIHKYKHDPSVQSYGREAADALGIAKERVFKTLVVSVDGKELAVAVVPVWGKLDLKAFASALRAKKAAMADPAAAERATGYVTGGISPLGQKRRLPMILDESALSQETIHVSAGKRGLEIELKPQDLLALAKGRSAPIATK